MRLEIAVRRAALRQWHKRLADRLIKVFPDAAICFQYSEGESDFPAAVEMLLTLEKMLGRQSPIALCNRLGQETELPESNGEAPDIIIDVTGTHENHSQPACLHLRPLFDGSPEEINAIAALLAGCCPTIAIQNVTDGTLITAGLPSLETANGLSGGLDAVFSRVITLMEHALSTSKRSDQQKSTSITHSYSSQHVGTFLARSVAHACMRQIYHLCCYSPNWRIGWRMSTKPGVLENGDLSGAQWNVLPETGIGFSADPFAIEWRGQKCIFFEAFDNRSAKGVIFAQPFDESGPIGKSFLVLEEPWHLSYPMLIIHNDELYMVPEASASSAVSIYRCVEFPGKWQRESELLTNIEAADATIFRHDGRFWMTSVVRDGIGGYSDTLAIHYADDLFGPWTEHAARPVLVDSRVARPAGAVVKYKDALWRPVQDCSNGYGKRLGLARIDVLTPQEFSQTVTTFIGPGAHWPGNRLHTLNRYGTLECIDGAILTPKSATLRRLSDRIIDRR